MGKRARRARKRPFLDISYTLIVESLGAVRGGRHVFADVGFRLGPGEALELTGANGAGKSTLLRAVAGLLPLAAGRVRMEPADDTPITERIHLLGHLDGLKIALTARENLAFAAAVAGPADDPSPPRTEGGRRADEASGTQDPLIRPVGSLLPARRGEEGMAEASVHAQPARPLFPLEALDRLGLAAIADLPVAYLSAGQRRRVAIGRLLVARRPLWLLDEPLNALDTAAQETLRSLIADHRATGGLVIAATHARLGLPHARDLGLSA